MPGKPRAATCAEGGCENAVQARGLCSKHYTRLYRNGDLEPIRTPDGEARKFIEEVALNFIGEDCLIWPFPRQKTGYGRVYVDGKHLMAHRYICERTNGPPPAREYEASHSCGKGHQGCVSPMHLTWKTPKQNQADRITHGTDMRGVKHWAVRLTEADVLKIRALDGALSRREIGEMFGVSTTQIGCIIRRESWSHIPSPEETHNVIH